MKLKALINESQQKRISGDVLRNNKDIEKLEIQMVRDFDSEMDVFYEKWSNKFKEQVKKMESVKSVTDIGVRLIGYDNDEVSIWVRGVLTDGTPFIIDTEFD